ncbi:MAG: hypothetical protein Harvfovirus3_23 [Harvfovirus sp.]|uniref:Uncharacterized protein n=1 Tax=Harvfovirus sp. TaxID=2487768 RepID=A0A3G5A072_9VIRU|nr:MAG: hypothetical protein Harvfovirus3_23 [Harvfovirus sp.]
MEIFSREVYKPLGHLAFVLNAARTKNIPINVNLKRKSNVLIVLSIFVNALAQSVSLTFDIKRDDDTIINGPQTFVMEPQSEGGVYAIPFTLLDEKVPCGELTYVLELHNKGEDNVRIDNYTFAAYPLRFNDYFSVNQIFTKYGEMPAFVIKAMSQKIITLDINHFEKSNVILYFSALISNNSGEQISFDILKNKVSMINGEQELVALEGSYMINWVTVDESDGLGRYQFVLRNKGVGLVRIVSYSFIGLVRENVASNSEYGVAPLTVKSLARSIATPFKLQGFSGVNIITMNFELGFSDTNANLYYNIIRDDQVSITNGPQPWVLSFGQPMNLSFSTNSVIIDPCAPDETKFYTIEMINQDSVGVSVPYYSLTNQH